VNIGWRALVFVTEPGQVIYADRLGEAAMWAKTWARTG
jgi:hypothetical protein